MYKGSCFREACADAGAVGGYLTGSTGVYTVYIYINSYPFYIVFQGSSEKGSFSESCTC